MWQNNFTETIANKTNQCTSGGFGTVTEIVVRLIH